MEKRTADVEYPSREEIRREVGAILACGLPQKKTLWGVLGETLRSVGLKAVLGGAWGGACVLLLVLFLCLPLSVNLRNQDVTPDIIFIFSPLVYLSAYLLSGAREIAGGTYEVVMACKYNLRYLLALRMLFVSVCGLVVNAALFAFLCLRADTLVFFTLFSISLCALFLCALLFLWLLRRPRRFITVGVLALCWLLINGLLFLLPGNAYRLFIGGIPAGVYFALALCLLALSARELKKFVTAKTWEGVQAYAHRR